MIDRFVGMSRAELSEALEQGHPIEPAALAGARYRGVSLGLPAWVDRLAWKTFEKDFVPHTEGSAALRGWNVRLEQTGLDGPVVPRQHRGEPVRFGHFDVRGRADGTLDLDYSTRRNGRLDPIRRLRDPLVALEAGAVTWLLGASDVAVRGRRLRTPSYFVLQRLGPVERVPGW